METPCQRPKTLEGRRSDLERGTADAGSVVGFVLVRLLGVYSIPPIKTTKLLRHQLVPFAT